MIAQRRREVWEAENLNHLLRKLQAWNIIIIEIRIPSTNHFYPLPPPRLTSIRSHLPERRWPVGRDGGHGVIGRVLQIRQAGSQFLAHSVAGTGVAPVAGLRQVGHEGASRRLGHRTVPGDGQGGLIIIFDHIYVIT